MKPRAPGKKTMRVAATLTGVTACAAGFLPTAAAHAASSAARPGNLPKILRGDGKLVRLKVVPDGKTAGPGVTADPAQPYWLDILFKKSVTDFQACGWHPNNRYACTPVTTNSKYGRSSTVLDVGGNAHSWDLGKITVAWNSLGPGHRDSCNTNGAWHGEWISGASGYESALLTSTNYGPIGNGVPEC